MPVNFRSPLIFFMLMLWLSAAMAKIVRIEITSRQSPTFEGRVFGSVGAYEKLRGKAYGEVDPNLPQNAVITDILLAPRNARGMVEYSMDIYILKPIDLTKGNHKLFIDVPNRGNKDFGGFNGSSGGNDPTTAAQAGDAFLMNMGYTIVCCGWDISADDANNKLTITVPVARYLNKKTVKGSSYEYISFDNENTRQYKLAYAADSLDKESARLTVREHLNDQPTAVPADGWEYINDRSIRLLPVGTAFKQSAIYEFTYTAKDPLVAGLGFAATRDFISFLRHAKNDGAGDVNPLAGDVQHTFSYTVSQPARYINDFQTLGFNEDEQGKRVIDGIENWLGGGSGIGLNYRFAQPTRTERNRQNHLYPEAIFPFAYPVLDDDFSKKKAGRSSGYRNPANYPRVFEINSANEYWVKAASLLHSDLQGHDLPDPANVRFFLVSGAQHGTGNASTKGSNQQLQNPTNAEPLLRALFMALDEWVCKGVNPPDSRVPRMGDGTAVLAVPQKESLTGVVPKEALGWPDLPGVTYTGLITTRYHLDYGLLFKVGIMMRYPPDLKNAAVYPNFVSKVDADGNEIAGIRLPPVAAPVATLTGWALRRAGFAENDGGESSGQFIPFRRTKAERLAAGDPRLSLEERYINHEGYVNAVAKAAHKLEGERLLLPADVEKYISAAKASSVLK